MVATDVAGRGIDIKDVSMVINYDMAKSIEGNDFKDQTLTTPRYLITVCFQITLIVLDVLVVRVKLV